MITECDVQIMEGLLLSRFIRLIPELSADSNSS